MKKKCKNCNREFSDQPSDKPVKVYEHEGEFLCEECLVGRIPLPPHDAESHDSIVWKFTTMFLP